MIYRIEEHAKVQALLLYHTYGSNVRLNEASRNKSLKLLYEMDSEQEDKIVNNTKEDIVNVKKIMDNIIKLLPPDEAKEMIDELKRLTSLIPNPSKIENELFAGDLAKMREISKAVTVNTGNAVRAASSMANGLKMVAKALEPFIDELSAEELDKPISELFEDENMKDKFIPKDKFEAGVRKAFVPDKGFESAFQKGIKAANTQLTSGEDGKSGLGKFFSKIGKFFAGATFQKAAVEAFPKLYEAFKAYLGKAKIKDVKDLSEKIKANEGKLFAVAARDAAAAGAQVGVATQDAAADDKGNKPTSDGSPADGAEVATENPKLTNQIAGNVDNPDAARALKDIGGGTDPKAAAKGLDKETLDLLKALLAKLGAEGKDADPKEVATEAQQEVPGGGEEPAADQEVPKGTVVTVDGVKYQKGEVHKWFDAKETSNDNKKKSWNRIKNNRKLLTKIEDAAKEEMKDQGSKAEIKKSLAKYKDKFTPGTAKELKDMGLIERKVPKLTEAFLFETKIETKTVQTVKQGQDEDMLGRWQQLAGIK